MRIGQRMAQLREQAGRSQDAVASRLQVSQGTISRWERGELPKLDRLIDYARVIDADIFAILEPARNTPPNPRAQRLARELLALLEEGGDEAE